ncbi:NucA/NucB deoxyribonuclease domain-containing protein [Shimazuella kribbensis]|uniref:NucA/NucB deoxyribonuclease domain-containing protein n=1 Tax=Shimazuella kribbensis TaxID=139808 RepID=UPI0004107F91|nr:NucA/NucB deoxyribonuclease domain-containing protein [Shimazuella kribbensis]
MYRKKTLYWLMAFCCLLTISILSSCNLSNPKEIPAQKQKETPSIDNVIVIDFPSDKYPSVADHIKDAIRKGKPSTCTIDRKGADQNRDDSLANVPTKKGYDRDEFPMAMCKEGGKGADIRYIKPKENRGAGSWFSNKVRKYPNGTVVKINVK